MCEQLLQRGVDMLETELNFYQKQRADWLKRFPGKFVLVKDAQLIGTFDTYEAALVEGARRFKLESFLVRAVNQAERQVSIPALVLGLLNANPPHAVQRPGNNP